MNLKFESMGKIKDFPVSDIVGKFIVFKDELQATITDVINKFSSIDSSLVFGYVFPLKEDGLYIAKIATGSLDEENNVVINNIGENTEYKLFPQKNDLFTLEYSEIEDCDFIFTDDLSEELKEKYYNALPFIRDRISEEICKDKRLDSFRDSSNPLKIIIDGREFKLENRGSYGFVGKFVDDGTRAIVSIENSEITLCNDYCQTALAILSKLKSSPEYNRKYLKAEFEKHRDNREVRDVILSKYAKQLEGFDEEIFQSRVLKYNDEILDRCERFIDISKSGDPKKALNDITEFISSYSCKNDYVISHIEKDIFRMFFDENHFIARQDLSNLFRALGVISNDCSLSEKALEVFKKAYALNPVNVDNLIELAVYYLDSDLEKCKSTLDLGFKYAYSVENLQELYFILEGYYLKIGDEERVRAIHEVQEGNYENASRLGIPIDFSNEVLSLILGKLRQHIYESEKESAMYYLNLLIGMRKCQVEEMSDKFRKYIETEYIQL